MKKNTENIANITALNRAVSDTNGEIVFYELPNLYSEYNSSDLSQYENEEWFSKVKPVENKVKALSLDELLQEHPQHPAIIKIDVEGSEEKAISGANNLLENSPQIVMEYLAPSRGNTPHKDATKTLKGKGFKTFLINHEGSLQHIDDIDAYLIQNNLESDNIVFKKP